MTNFRLSLSSVAVAGALLSAQNYAVADSVAEAIENGTASGNFRLRYESVDQDNALDDASALTLRSRLGYKTGEISGFSAYLEFEDSRVVGGQDDYNNTAGKGSEYSVIADPEVTEVDQGFLQYKGNGLTAKIGRQVITTDNHRFVGHVGWRQDRQTFDAATFNYAPTDNVSLMYGYINNRNRIFAENKDVQSKDHILNASYKTPVGKLVGYAYLLEEDTSTDNALDTVGIRFSGSSAAGTAKILYTAEYATQSFEAGSTDYDATYFLLEGGASVSGITAKIGYEVLGSDSGSYGFSTPLATLHKFNGWSDQFLGTPTEGLVDLYAMVGSKIGPGKLTLMYHDFSAEEDTDTIDDYGREIDLSYAIKFSKHYNAGIKYASYEQGDDATGKVDTDKLWVWLGAAF